MFLLLVISLFGFFSSIIIYFIYSAESKIGNIFFCIMLITEVLTLYLFFTLEKQRNERAKIKYQKIYKNENLTLLQVKKKWFSETLVIPNNEYITLIESIEKFYLIQSNYQGGSLNREKIYNFIFSTDSKNRVIAMFMGLVALFTALLISTGVNVEYIFDIFKSIYIFESLFYVGFISIFLFGVFSILKYTFFMIVSSLDFIFDNFSNINNISKRKKEIFIKQLLQFAEFPKRRQRVYAILEVSKSIDSDTV